MDYAFILGNIAAVLTSVSFLPQVLQIIKTKDTRSISLPMYLLFVAGVMIWLIYGILISSFPVILANTFTIIFSGLVLYYKLTEGLRDRKLKK